MATKTKSKSLQDQFTEREEAALAEHHETLEAVDATRERAVALQEQADLAELAADDIEARLKRGDETVTAMDLLTGRAEHERTKLLADGRQARWRALNKKAEASYRKDVAEVVLEALLSSEPFAGVAGITGLATFHTKGWEPESVDVTGQSGPVLIVTQHSGGIDAEGVGEAKLTIVWHRPPLTVPLTGEVIGSAFKRHGFSSRGFGVFSEDTYDRLGPSEVYNVSTKLPVIPASPDPRERFSAWSREWAGVLQGKHRAACASALGRPRVEVREEGSKRITTVHVEASLWADGMSRYGMDCDLGAVQRWARESYVHRVSAGVGRCVSAEPATPRERNEGRHMQTATLLTYEAAMG